jgi:hypothetical protein
MQDEPYDDPNNWEPREVRIARHVGALGEGVGALIAAPPYPEAEILTAFRLKSGMAGLPHFCPRGTCRRAKSCRAGDIDAGAACGAQFSAETERDFQAMVLGVLIAWRAQCARATREAAALARWSGAETNAAPLSRGRRAAKRKG